MKLKLYKEFTVEDKKYILVHAGLGNFNKNKKLKEYNIMELVWDRMDYEKVYFEDKYLANKKRRMIRYLIIGGVSISVIDIIIIIIVVAQNDNKSDNGNNEEQEQENPKNPDGSYDYECLEAVDLKLFDKQVGQLLKGEEVLLPTFNFIFGKSILESSV